MVRIASTILQYTDLEDILAAITRELAQVIDFDRSSVSFISDDRKALILKHIYKGNGEADKIGDGRRIPLNDTSVIGWVAQNRKAILRRDIATDGRFFEVVKEEQLQCDMIVPLIARGNVMGTLNVGCYEANTLSDDDLEMLVNCGNIACGAIEHAVLLQEAKDLGERYRTLQRNASDIMMLIDRNTGRLVEVNRKCCEVLGYSEGDLLRRSYFELFPREDQFQARRDFINTLSRKTSAFSDRRLIAQDGDIIFVDISASLIEIKQDTFIQVLVHDVSQRRMLEQQILHQNQNLQVANRKLREVDRMKTEFLANISHELKTPLSIIIAYTDSLRDGSVEPEQQEQFLAVINENGQHLLRLINNLLDLSKLEVSGAMLSTTLSHIHDVINALWTDVVGPAEAKGIRMHLDLGEGVPVSTMDNNRIHEVLNCLVSNAIKFTPPGGRVDLRTRQTAEGVLVEVEDTGPGISAEHLPNLFDAFHQIDGSTTREWGGLGIGLAMAEHIVGLHGGKIWVESEEGKGSRFCFMLPAQPGDMPLAQGAAVTETPDRTEEPTVF